MSVYSGFATRQQEQQYNKQLVNLVKVLQKRVFKFYSNEVTEENAFKAVISQIYTKLAGMEDSKYLQPHFSEYIDSLQKYLQQGTFTPQPSIPSNNTFICNCQCHQNHKPNDQSIIGSAFLTCSEVSALNILQPIVKPHEKMSTSKVSSDLVYKSASARPYFSVQRGSSVVKQTPTSSDTSKQINRPWRREQEAVPMKVKNMRLDKQFHSRQISPLNQLNRQQRTPPNITRKSPYYSVVYCFNGQNFNKAIVEKQASLSKNFSSPRSKMQQVQKSIMKQKPFIRHNKSVQETSSPKSLEGIMNRTALNNAIINEVSSVQETDYFKIERKKRQENQYILQNQAEDFQLTRQSYTMENIPNPNEQSNEIFKHD